LAKSVPVFNAPTVVLVTLAALIAIHVGRDVVGEDLDQWVVLATAFIPARYAGEVLPGGSIAKVTSFLTHAFLHGDFTHLAVNCGWMLAFGSIVARRIGAVRYLLLWAVAAIAGAALFLAMNWALRVPMVGASGAISGLMGAANRFMFQSSYTQSYAPAMPLGELLRDRRARLMIGSWVVLNMLFGLVLGKFFSEGGIAWEAHLGGFFAGLLLFPLFDRAMGTPLMHVEDTRPEEH
jgi:membrane associated rhomboid family serine protease